MKVSIYAQAIIRDKNGNIVRRTKKVKCNSYVRQFIDNLCSQMVQAAQNIRDTSNTVRSVAIFNSAFKTNAGAGDASNGIVVGTGTNAVTISDYNLQTQVANGSEANQLLHGIMSYAGVALIGSKAQFTLTRTLTNNSGGDINIKEVGLIEFNQWYFLLERTLLEFTIADTESGTVTYTISVTV